MTSRVDVPLEWREQVALVKWLSAHPILKDLYFKNDNEGKRDPRSAVHAQRMGLRRGVSDLFICYPSRGFHGLFLEMKRSKKYVPSEMSTPTWIAQVKFIENVKSVGYAAEMCYGFQEARKIIESYLQFD